MTTDALMQAFFLAAILGMLIALVGKRIPFLAGIGLVLLTYSLAFWMITFTYVNYTEGLAPVLGRSSAVVSMSERPTYSLVSIVFHVALAIFLLCAGTYFAAKRFRSRSGV